MLEFKDLCKTQPELLTQENYDKVRKKCPKIIQNQNNDNFDEAVWDICLEGDEDELPNGEPDVLVICDIWYVVVHQGWYLRDIEQKVPEGDWLCQRCMNVVFHQKLPKCKYCSDPQGAMVKCLLPSTAKKGSKQQLWAHISWVNWLTGIWFEGEELVTQSKNESAGLRCKICGQKDNICLQWDYKNCCESFHVRCAMKSGLIKADMDDQIDPEDDDKRFIFCKKHQPDGIKILKEQGSKGLQPDLEPDEADVEPEKEKERIEKLNQRLKELKSKVAKSPKKRKITSSKGKLGDDFLNNAREELGLNRNTNNFITESYIEPKSITSNVFKESEESKTFENIQNASPTKRVYKHTDKFVDFRAIPSQMQLSLLQRAASKINECLNIWEISGKVLPFEPSLDMFLNSEVLE